MEIWERYRKTALFVTHSIREAVYLSDRVLVMGRRPATIVDEVMIELPRPRSIAMTEEDGFNHIARHLRRAIEASHAG
jgi:NitT/TauT family transport system ATP-binding protein